MGLTVAGQDRGEQNQVDPSEKGLLLQQLESDTFEKRDEALKSLQAAPDLLEDALIGLFRCVREIGVKPMSFLLRGGKKSPGEISDGSLEKQ